MKYVYKKVDAFTTQHSLGNPAACIYLNEGESLSEAQMLSIAKAHEHFVCEMAFCKACKQTNAEAIAVESIKQEDTQQEDALEKNGKVVGIKREDALTECALADYDMRYYSSECEVDFCGHGTIACMYSLIQSHPELLEQKTLRIRTQKGILNVYNEIKEQDAVYITAPNPKYYDKKIDLDRLAEALRMSTNEITNEYPIEVIDAGLKTLIVPLVNLKSEVADLPIREELERYVRDQDIDIVLIFSKETENPSAAMHTRVFAPKFGYLEDPATGSGNSAFGYYMLKHHIWQGEPIRIEQGNTYGAFNEMCLMTREDETGVKVLFGGRAKVRIEGYYLVED